MAQRTRQLGSLEQLRRHNLHRVLRAVYSGAAESRAELAVVTGLTKPTVSTLVGELLAAGLISERGPGRSGGSGGKRPTLLSFEPLARQVIGVSVVGNRALGALSDLAGETSALHVCHLPQGEEPAALPGVVVDVVAALLPQLDAPLLGVGVGLPGSGNGRTLVQQLAARFGVPVHVGNQAELSALGQLAFADGVDKAGTLVNLIVDGGIEMGVGRAGGAVHYGSDLGDVRLSAGDRAGDEAETLRERLAWGAVRERVAAVLDAGPESAGADFEAAGSFEAPQPSYLRLRSAAVQGNESALRLIDELAADLAPVLALVVAAVRPDQVSLGGRLSDLGEAFLRVLRERAGRHLPAAQLDDVTLSLAYSEQLGAMGAVALVMQEELELFGP